MQSSVPLELSQDPDWEDYAECRNADPETFFPPSDLRGRELQRAVADAKAICFRCPVRTNCLNLALDMELNWGVFGGMDKHEREDILRRRARQGRSAAA
jgi:WhiB family redox-sensing transcriptional regulator